MKQYLALMNAIKENGVLTSDRTGVGRIRTFGHQLRFDMADGFPMVTTKKGYFGSVKKELEWMVSGKDSSSELKANGCGIWDMWEVKEDHIDDFIVKYLPGFTEAEVRLMKHEMMTRYLGSIGPIYGPNWRSVVNTRDYGFGNYLNQPLASDHELLAKTEYSNAVISGSISEAELPEEGYLESYNHLHLDQLQRAIHLLKTDPYSSRIVVSAWVPDAIPFEGISPQHNVLLGKGALAPCHMAYQFFAAPSPEGNKLSLQLYQRSADVPVGVPFNIAQYSLLLMIVAKHVGMIPHEFIWTVGDAHIYADQLGLVDTQLFREPLKMPTLVLPEIPDIFSFDWDAITLMDYAHLPNIPYPVAM